MGRRCANLIFTGALLLCVTASQAAVVFVDSRASTCGDGQSWATAYKYLQDALTAARNSGGTISEIRVAVGTYQPDRDCAHPTGSRSRTATFQLLNNVALRGGYAGSSAPEPGARDTVANVTILSGDLAGDDTPVANPLDMMTQTARAENCYHVMTGSGKNATSVIDGFTIFGGNANGVSDPDHYGGGMYNYYGSPTLINCTFSGNSAAQGGGVCTLGSVSLTNCTFDGNCASVVGGGLDNMLYSSEGPNLTRCTFIGNSAKSGGGMSDTNGSKLTDCTFIGNTAASSGNGGGMQTGFNCYSCSLTNCMFMGNSGAGWGGGIFRKCLRPRCDTNQLHLLSECSGTCRWGNVRKHR